MSLPFDPSSLFDLADKLGVIQVVKDKLFRNPDVAAEKLVTVLAEISKIYGVLECELVRYLSLSFDPGGDLKSERAVLLTLEGGQLMARASEARGHCHKIRNIYQNHLSRWFHQVLSPQEADEVESLFDRLSYGDSQMELAIRQLADWLVAVAQQTLDLVDESKLDEANKLVRAARREAQPARLAISNAMSQLVMLQGEVIAASGTD